MAAITQPEHEQHWKDKWIERSEAITDAWEVTKTYAGRIAEWVLFGCMIANIIEVLPGVHFWNWVSNSFLGIQIIALDVGGFSLNTLADQAKERGDRAAARKANTTGWFLIGLMIVTLLCVAVSLLFPETATFVSGVEKGLVLVRVVMIVIYGKVIHSLRNKKGALQVSPAMQDRLATLVQSVVQSQIQLVQSNMVQLVQSELTTHHQLVQSEVQRVVQSVVDFDAATLVQSVVQDALQLQSNQLVEQINAVRREVKREIKTTITEVQETSSASAVNSVQGSVVSRKRRETTLPTTLPETMIIEETALDTTLPKTMQVVHYLTQQTALGNMPSLTDIEKAINCTRRTAIDGKREWERRSLLAAPATQEDETC